MSAFESSTRIAIANGALLSRDRPVEHRSISEHIEEACLRSTRNLREPDVPVPEEQAQLVAQLGEVAEAGFQFGEPLGNQRADAPARRATTITLRQDGGEILQRKANGQGPPHQSNAPDGLGWVDDSRLDCEPESRAPLCARSGATYPR